MGTFKKIRLNVICRVVDYHGAMIAIEAEDKEAIVSRNTLQMKEQKQIQLARAPKACAGHMCCALKE